MSKIVLPAGARGALAALGAALLLSACADSGSAPPAPAATAVREERSQPVRAYTLAPRTLGRSVLVAGTVEPLRSIALAARTDGVVAEVAVEAGDRVRAGQLLARIDVSEQQAELARAEAALREARANFERLDALRGRSFVDAASVLSARSALEVAESEVALWRTRVEFGRIEASIDGYVIARLIEPGAAVGRLAPAFELADLDQLVLRVGVSELDAARIAPGAEVEVAVDALAGENVEARVRRVFPAADPSSRLVTVELQLPQAHARGVRPGFLARARFAIEARSDVLAVPAAAVGLGEQSFVMVIDADGRLVRREVETGVVRGEWREITAGLDAGERIVATSPLELAAGDRVRVVETVGDEA
ncbi:efflux RND transporter periplasmic adaptor subunit [Aquimonas voraii]|uniref:Barrel-sandwich domain of CusB or HlyD membrane-fusion n=1 Tax=Aquimonas voraii TaxID=265719 RepID=A0A1G6VG99_9GAMM|nr:efflux RND transporter periplasmic adaptor subunit [Aquimonas voraii]SDD51935.1 Barrel-sandwich domain of CusB or HlyD membrane-fusion [Aquimonas voraii]